MKKKYENQGVEACDTLIAADFTKTGERAYRLAQEIRSLASNGNKIGLIQFRKPGEGEAIAPEIQTCVRRGYARVIDADAPATARRLVIHEPSCADWSLSGLAKPEVSDVVHVCYQEADFGAGVKSTVKARQALRAAPVNPFLGAATSSGRAQAKQYWLPMLPLDFPARSPRPGVPAVGWLGNRLDIALFDCVSAAADGPEPDHFLLEWAAAGTADIGGRARVLGPLSLDRLIAGLDVLAVVPSGTATDLPDTIIAWALAAGLEVVLPDWLEAHYGRGPRYALPGQIAAAVRDAAAAVRQAGQRDAPAEVPDFVARCRRHSAELVFSHGLQDRTRVPAKARPTLCLAANGVGVGHLTRLLAIARRIEGEVVFASQVPALEILKGYGFHGDYIPSAATVGGDFDQWDAWFGAHLTRLLDRYDPATVVYDGNHPSWGLVGAVASRRDCGLAWIRRGMWANTTSAHLSNARWCDLVIEPGELAGERDQGVTAGLRHEAVQVDPIRLLEEHDLFDRNEAAVRLGLDPRRPAVLIQLGSGYNRDLLSLLEQIVGMLSRTAGLQIALAEWVNGTIPLTLWPGVKVLRGFPISQYLRAFDFCISAAGYNSFHELIGFSVPTIFIANRHPTMDDQYNRAKFAQDSAAAFEISEHDLRDLPDLIGILMQERPREFLVQHCRKLIRANGAVTAAHRLDALSRNAEGVSP